MFGVVLAGLCRLPASFHRRTRISGKYTVVSGLGVGVGVGSGDDGGGDWNSICPALLTPGHNMLTRTNATTRQDNHGMACRRSGYGWEKNIAT